VVPEAAFKDWYFGPEDAPLPRPAAIDAGPTPAVAGQGKPRGLVILERENCLACHSLDGSVMVGPSFKGRFGSRDVVQRGTAEVEVTIDEAYLRRAIRDPEAEIVKGYPPGMPKAELTDDELQAVIQYLKTVR
jgi:cytochrome c oxidase subunit II